MQYKSLLIVIPTRNRADLAINAINSVLSQENCDFEVVISDNSTEEREVEKLSAFCEKITDSRLRYIRPSQPLPMSDHWNWAMIQALSFSSASHIIYLTDRFILKPFALKDLVSVVSLYPEKIISYSWDLINDIGSPIYSFQLIRTEKLYEVSSQDLLDLSSQTIFTYSLPRMLNCCCPRKTMEAIYKKHGYYFFSNSPDFYFIYTCLEMEDSILFYDNPLVVSYGLSVSNGTSFLRGLFNKTNTTNDFIKTTKLNSISSNLIFNLPISAIQYASYEYELVKQLSNNSKFKDLDEDKFLRKLLGIVLLYEDKQEKLKTLRKIVSINKIKFPMYILQAYLTTYTQRLIQKLKSKVRSSNALEIIKTHHSLEDAMSDIINHPRPLASNKSFFEIRIGRSPRELKRPQ